VTVLKVVTTGDSPAIDDDADADEELDDKEEDLEPVDAY
jgi:hypothetical protein